MKQALSPLIQAKDLATLSTAENLILVDVSNGKNAFENDQRQHLDKALFIDLNTDLAHIKDDFAKGGRHPLPTIEKFSGTLSRLGITKESHVVVYDGMQSRYTMTIEDAETYFAERGSRFFSYLP